MATGELIDPIAAHHGGTFVDTFTDQLARAAAALTDERLADRARRALLTQLARRWLGCAITAFVADGGAPRGAFAWQTFLIKYPVCARLFAESEASWRGDVARLLAATARAFPGEPIAALVHDAGFLGSRRSAHLLTFASGQRAVYRPYPLPAAPWFMEVCGALELPTRALRVEGEVTWDEHVAPQPCPADAHARYFRTAGRFARLLEAVRGKDMHLRNVRIVGDAPVILDLEGVLAHRDDVSPLTAGFLPVVARDPTGARIELGGLHPGGVVTLAVRQPRLVVEGAPRFEHAFSTREVDATTPAPIGEHVDDVLAGYAELDAALGRLDLRALAARVTFPSAVFARPGIAYRALLFASMAPALLTDEAARDRMIAQAAPHERGPLRALRAVRYTAPAPAPDFAPHDDARHAACAALIRAAIAATTGSAG